MSAAAAGVLVASAATAASAGDGAVSVPLAPGEVLVEVDAAGTAVRPADAARLIVMLTVRAATPAQAREALEAQIRRATSAARAAGVRAQDIRPMRAATRFGFIGNEAPEEELTRADTALAEQFAQAQDAPPQSAATRSLELRAINPADATRLRRAMEDAGFDTISGPFYRLDEAHADEARRAAHAEAMRRARAEADSLAAAAGMRVARLLRIDERMAPDVAAWTVYAAMFPGSAELEEERVETQVRISVDFALAPR